VRDACARRRPELLGDEALCDCADCGSNDDKKRKRKSQQQQAL
jgi:hypothetical protein